MKGKANSIITLFCIRNVTKDKYNRVVWCEYGNKIEFSLELIVEAILFKEYYLIANNKLSYQHAIGVRL